VDVHSGRGSHRDHDEQQEPDQHRNRGQVAEAGSHRTDRPIEDSTGPAATSRPSDPAPSGPAISADPFESIESAPSRWKPVVFGRTHKVDEWWRAVPDELDRYGWLGAMVSAVVGGGHGLDRRQRILLAHGRDGTLLGVACRAGQLHDTMSADEHGRPLFCFVGWWHPPVNTPVRVPTAAQLREGSLQWTRPVYELWMGKDWEQHAAKVRGPHASTPVTPPWLDVPAAPAAPPDVAAQPRSESDHTLTPAPAGHLRLHPATQADQVWAALSATPGEVALVVGWAEYRDGLAAAVTDLCADDVGAGSPRTLPRPPAAAPARRDTPASVPYLPVAGEEPPAGRERPSIEERYRNERRSRPDEPLSIEERYRQEQEQRRIRAADDHRGHGNHRDHDAQWEPDQHRDRGRVPETGSRRTGRRIEDSETVGGGLVDAVQSLFQSLGSFRPLRGRPWPRVDPPRRPVPPPADPRREDSPPWDELDPDPGSGGPGR
jgi:hypothetical protein